MHSRVTYTSQHTPLSCWWVSMSSHCALNAYLYSVPNSSLTWSLSSSSTVPSQLSLILLLRGTNNVGVHSGEMVVDCVLVLVFGSLQVGVSNYVHSDHGIHPSVLNKIHLLSQSPTPQALEIVPKSKTYFRIHTIPQLCLDCLATCRIISC